MLFHPLTTQTLNNPDFFLYWRDYTNQLKLLGWLLQKKAVKAQHFLLLTLPTAISGTKQCLSGVIQFCGQNPQ